MSFFNTHAQYQYAAMLRGQQFVNLQQTNRPTMFRNDDITLTFIFPRRFVLSGTKSFFIKSLQHCAASLHKTKKKTHT